MKLEYLTSQFTSVRLQGFYFKGFQSVSLNDYYLSLCGSHMSQGRAEDFDCTMV